MVPSTVLPRCHRARRFGPGVVPSSTVSDEAARPEGPALPRCPHCGADHPSHLLKCPDTDLILPLEGRILHGKFRFVHQLGKGGMAAVWSAVNTLVDRSVAIKLIRPEAGRSEETVARFRAEAKAAGRIGHLNVCEILDFGLGPVGPYIVMERLRGLSLGQLIRREQRLDPALAVTIIRQALAGLSAAHQRGIIHRDLKPENLFVHQPEGGAAVVKLMDFGVSKLTDGSSEVQTEHGALLGTPEYMSPEQFKGAARSNERTDIWAMGAILYKALTGKTAFGGATVAGTLLMVTTEEPTPIPELVRGVPPELVAIVERCLSKDPKERFASAEALSDELEPFDLDNLDTLHLVDPDRDPDAPTPETVDEEPDGAESAEPEQPSDHGPETILPTTRRMPSTTRRPSRPERRAWLLIGVTAVGAGLLVMLARGPAPSDPSASNDPPAADEASSSTPMLAVAGSSGAARPTDHPPTESDEPSPSDGSDTGTTRALMSTAASSSATSTGPTDESTTDLTTSTEGISEPTDSEGGDDDAISHDRRTPGPRVDPSSPPPTPPGTVRVERLLTPKTQGPSGTLAQAKAYCRGLAQQSFAGVDSWRLVSPVIARKLAKAARRGKYWTTALWRGKALTLALPSQKQTSRAADKSGPRALCFARWP